MQNSERSRCVKSSCGFISYVLVAISVLAIAAISMTVYILDLPGGNNSARKSQLTRSFIEQVIPAVIARSADTDSDGELEAPAWVSASPSPADGGGLPANIAGPKTDAWGHAFGYCSWDNGTTNTSTNRLTGDNPGSDSSIVFALVSAGPDRQFATTCANIKAGTVNGDDIVQTYTVAQLRQGLPNDAYQGVPVANGSALSALNTSGMLTCQMRVQDDTSALMAWTGASWSEVVTNGGAGGINLYNRLKNYFINGDMMITQRGTAWSPSLGGAGSKAVKTADHWRVTVATDDSYDGASASVNVYNSYNNYGNWPTSIQYIDIWPDLWVYDAATYVSLEQPVEGVARLAGKTLTLSLYAAAGSSDTVQVWITQNFGTGGTPSAAITTKVGTLTLTGGWSRQSVTFTMPAIPNGTVFGTNGDDYTLVSIREFKGYEVYYTLLQLEDGAQASLYEYLNNGLELTLCQRYFQKGDTSAASTENYATYYAPVTGSLTRQVKFRVPMRAAPAVTIAANTGGAVSVSNVTPGSFTATQSIGATGVFTSAIGWKADADW